MPVFIPGLGAGTPLFDLVTNYRRLAANLPMVIEQFPEARAVRNRVGNLSIVVDYDDRVDAVGWIDVRTGDIEVYDEPWPISGEI